MTIEAGIYAYLTAQAGITSLVGTRIYPVVLPQGTTLPAITYQRVSGPRVRSQSGPSGLASPRFQFSVWATSYDQAKAVAQQLRLALDGYRGLMGGGVDVQSTEIAGDVDAYEPDTALYAVHMDFVLWHSE